VCSAFAAPPLEEETADLNEMEKGNNGFNKMPKDHRNPSEHTKVTTNIHKLFRSFTDNHNTSNPQSLFSASVGIATSTDPTNLSVIQIRFKVY
jgi:hypothetical protein